MSSPRQQEQGKKMHWMSICLVETVIVSQLDHLGTSLGFAVGNDDSTHYYCSYCSQICLLYHAASSI